MNAVTVRRFDEHKICALDHIRVTQNGLIRLTEVSREDNLRRLPILLHDNLENCRAENMPRIAEGEPQIIHLQSALISDRLEQLECSKRICLCIERRDGSLAATRILTVEELCVTLLYVRRVRQHDANEIAGRARCIDFPTKPLTHKTRNTSAVVDVRMRQKDRLNLGRIKREILIVHLTQAACSLIHTAVYEIPVIAHMEQIA